MVSGTLLSYNLHSSLHHDAILRPRHGRYNPSHGRKISRYRPEHIRETLQKVKQSEGEFFVYPADAERNKPKSEGEGEFLLLVGEKTVASDFMLWTDFCLFFSCGIFFDAAYFFVFMVAA